MENILETKKEELEKFLLSFLEKITKLQLEIIENKNNMFLLKEKKYSVDEIILDWVYFELMKFLEEINYLKIKILQLKNITKNKTYSKN